MRPALILLLLATSLVAADAPPLDDATKARAEAEAAAYAADEAKKHPPALPESMALVKSAEADLLAAAELLERDEPAKAGERFVKAQATLGKISTPERKALGPIWAAVSTRQLALSRQLLALEAMVPGEGAESATR